MLPHMRFLQVSHNYLIPLDVLFDFFKVALLKKSIFQKSFTNEILFIVAYLSTVFKGYFYFKYIALYPLKKRQIKR